MKRNKNKAIKNGESVRDTITGFTGIVTGIVNYLTGCRQMLVQPPVDDKGDARKSQWYDEDRLERVDAPRRRLSISHAGSDEEAPRKP